MKISKKQWDKLEKRVAALEESQGKPPVVNASPLTVMKAALEESLCQAHQPIQIDIKIP